MKNRKTLRPEIRNVFAFSSYTCNLLAAKSDDIVMMMMITGEINHRQTTLLHFLLLGCAPSELQQGTKCVGICVISSALSFIARPSVLGIHFFALCFNISKVIDISHTMKTVKSITKKLTISNMRTH